MEPYCDIEITQWGLRFDITAAMWAELNATPAGSSATMWLFLRRDCGLPRARQRRARWSQRRACLSWPEKRRLLHGFAHR